MDFGWVVAKGLGCPQSSTASNTHTLMGSQVCGVHRPEPLPLGLAQTTMHLALGHFPLKVKDRECFLVGI